MAGEKTKYNPLQAAHITAGDFRPEAFLGENLQGYRVSRILLLTEEHIVYIAKGQIKNHPVAVKVFSPAFVSPEQTAEIMQFKLTISSLKSDSLAQVISMGTIRGCYYRIEEFIPNSRPLSTITLNKTIGWHIAKKYLYDILRGVQTLHHKGLAHGNLNLSNILLTRSGKVYLTNFGLSSDKSLFKKDLQAIGQMYYLMLMGHPITSIPSIPSVFNPVIPREVDEFIFRSAAISESDPFKTIDELCDYAHANILDMKKHTSETAHAREHENHASTAEPVQKYASYDSRNTASYQPEKSAEAKPRMIISSKPLTTSTEKKTKNNGCVGCIFIFVMIVFALRIIMFILDSL